ncbi:MAG: M14 family zinc carboxypeptidase [Candidatus Hydrogenedens sp.]
MKKLVLILLLFVVLSDIEVFAQKASLPIWYIVQVKIKSLSDIDYLEQQGYSVDSYDGNYARVYIPKYALKKLQNEGFEPQVIGTDPSPYLEKTPTGYHNYAELTQFLQNLTDTYPTLTRLMSLGQSVQRRELWALHITDNPDIEEDEPEFKYIATIHGDEPIGTELCLFFAEYLLQNYSTDTRIKNVVDEVSIWIVPLMNPDGREAVSRFNANGVDLNRSFPNYPTDFNTFYYDGGNISIETRQPEIQHIMRWSLEHNFSLSANFHTGAMVVNYPYDNDGGPSGVEAPTPDDALMKWIATQYAMHNTPMYTNSQFPGGITNGAEWYVVTGGMQDWNYRFTGCIEMTIELFNTKFPAGSWIPTLWNNNRESMLSYLECVLRGIRGLVYDRNTGDPVWTKVLVQGNTQPVFSHPRVGNYHRLLLPGTYNLAFTAPGYIPYRVNGIEVVDGWATRRDIPLSDGDINSDGKVNDEDVDLAVEVILGITPIDKDIDVDGNGLGASDIQAIINQSISVPIGVFPE